MFYVKLARKVFALELLLRATLEMTIVGSRIFALLVAISFFLCGLATQNAWSLDQRVRSLLEMQSRAPPWTCRITVCCNRIPRDGCERWIGAALLWSLMEVGSVFRE